MTPPNDRLAELETLVTHLERTIESLHEVALAQGERIDALQRQLAGLKGQVQSVADTVADSRLVPQEKPPHY